MEKFHRLATLMEVCVGLLNLIFHRRDDGSDHIVGLDLIACGRLVAVSYTHLTLPTILRV